ncbi:hypothetical protein [Streptomyces sp. NBC_00035]|uniref:hypothetical protein n=1 Tax=Streptomyces sp. NBC_00035 TaxID=2903614 RepID=UPI00324645C8
MHSMELPLVVVRGWKLVVVTAHGVRVWWHLERNAPWASGVDASLSPEAREYVMSCVLALQQQKPVPAPPVTADQKIPWDAFAGLIDLDVATLEEGDPA